MKKKKKKEKSDEDDEGEIEGGNDYSDEIIKKMIKSKKLEKLKVQELKDICKVRKINIKGLKKVDILEKINNYIEEAD